MKIESVKAYILNVLGLFFCVQTILTGKITTAISLHVAVIAAAMKCVPILLKNSRSKLLPNKMLPHDLVNILFICNY